jgi:hypothetical protein
LPDPCLRIIEAFLKKEEEEEKEEEKEERNE